MSLLGEDGWWHHAAKVVKTSTPSAKFHLHEGKETTLCGISLTSALKADFWEVLFLEHVPGFFSLPVARARSLGCEWKCQECEYEFTGRCAWSVEA